MRADKRPRMEWPLLMLRAVSRGLWACASQGRGRDCFNLGLQVPPRLNCSCDSLVRYGVSPLAILLHRVRFRLFFVHNKTRLKDERTPIAFLPFKCCQIYSERLLMTIDVAVWRRDVCTPTLPSAPATDTMKRPSQFH